MKYKVIQKIKALGLQVGDVFEEEASTGVWCREYKNGAKVCVPEFILKDHPEWFKSVRSTKKKTEEWTAYTTTWEQRPITPLQITMWHQDLRGLLHGIYLGVWALFILGVLCLILN